MKTLSIIGHANIENPFGVIYNPDEYNQKIFKRIYSYLFNFLKNKDVIICSGMARGIDEIIALIAIEQNKKLVLCIPKSIKWHQSVKPKDNSRPQAINYQKILDYKNINKIIEVEKSEDENVFDSRNTEIVKQSDEIYSFQLFNSLGTSNCVMKAIKENKYRGNLYLSLS